MKLTLVVLSISAAAYWQIPVCDGFSPPERLLLGRSAATTSTSNIGSPLLFPSSPSSSSAPRSQTLRLNYQNGVHHHTHHVVEEEEVLRSKKTFYEILGCNNEKATRQELKQCYVKLAKTTHPDVLIHVNGSNEDVATESFYDVAEAWMVLGDSKKRRKYDSELHASRITAQIQSSIIDDSLETAFKVTSNAIDFLGNFMNNNNNQESSKKKTPKIKKKQDDRQREQSKKAASTTTTTTTRVIITTPPPPPKGATMENQKKTTTTIHHTDAASTPNDNSKGQKAGSIHHFAEKEHNDDAVLLPTATIDVVVVEDAIERTIPTVSQKEIQYFPKKPSYQTPSDSDTTERRKEEQPEIIVKDVSSPDSKVRVQMEESPRPKNTKQKQGDMLNEIQHFAQHDFTHSSRLNSKEDTIKELKEEIIRIKALARERRAATTAAKTKKKKEDPSMTDKPAYFATKEHQHHPTVVGEDEDEERTITTAKELLGRVTGRRAKSLSSNPPSNHHRQKKMKLAGQGGSSGSDNDDIENLLSDDIEQFLSDAMDDYRQEIMKASSKQDDAAKQDEVNAPPSSPDHVLRKKLRFALRRFLKAPKVHKILGSVHEEKLYSPEEDVCCEGEDTRYFHFAYSPQKQKAVMERAYSLLEKSNSFQSSTRIRGAEDTSEHKP